jgi:hypothetical protein
MCGIPCECGTAYVADGKVVTYYGHSNSLFQENGSCFGTSLYNYNTSSLGDEKKIGSVCYVDYCTKLVLQILKH